MGISGNDRALMYAMAGVGRAGATRAGYHSPKVFVSVGGAHRANGKVTPSEKLEGLTISETNSETPNRASFRATGWVPEVGMEVEITLGSKNRYRRLFGGTVLDVKQSANGLLANFDVVCVDWSWILDDEPIYGHFTGSASEIAVALMADAPAGFSTRQVEAGLPTLDGGITFTGVKRSAALRRLAKRAGARTFIDYRKDLYFRVTPSVYWTNPTNIVGGLTTLKTFTFERDLSQIANRVPFIGGGANALTEVSVGETILPLTDAPDWWYGDVGGVVISGPQRISYTARVAGGGGSMVGTGAQPSSAPSLALAAGNGVTVGAHDVAIAFETASGISLPGQRALIVAGTVSSPSSGVTAGTPSSGGALDVGAHRYYPVFRTGSGSTTAGPVSNSVNASIESPPTNIGTCSNGGGGGVTHLSPNSLYNWKFTFRRASDGAETTPSPTSGIVTNGFGSMVRIDLAGCSAPPSGYTRRWYRTEANGGTYKRCDDPATSIWYGSENSGVNFSDGSSDASRGAAIPSTNNTVRGTCAVTGIPVSPSPLVTHVDMYREFNAAGASTAKLAFSVTNGTTNASDSIANSGLGATVPGSNTAAAGQIAMSSIQIGGTGATARLIYMTEADDPGGTLKLAATISNNADTTLTLTASDGSLGADAETVDTSGLAQPSGQVLPGETSVPVAGTAPFRAAGGWATTGTAMFRYAGFSGTALTGVPASGPGSITQPISFNTTIAAAPCLVGIPPSGEGSIRYTINKGDPVNLYVTVEDTDAQVGLQALLSAPAPVVRECPPLSDQRVSRAEALNRAAAFLSLRAYPGVRLGPYRSKDVNNRVGMNTNVNVTSPLTLNDTFQIQAVTITNFTPSILPDYAVQASDELFSVEAILAKEN